MVLVKEMREGGESKISLCCPGVRDLSLSLIVSEVVYISAFLLEVDVTLGDGCGT